MKRFVQVSLILVAAMAPMLSFAKKNKGTRAAAEPANVLIVGLNDNVKSNYYYDDLIAKEMGLDADSVDYSYNKIIAANISTVAPKSLCHFVSGSTPEIDAVAGKISVDGEGDECSTSVAQVGDAEWKDIFEKNNADYVLVLNQHYLKRQVEPMRTVFYIISYSLFDKDKKEVHNGNQYFSLIDLVSLDKMKYLSRKSSSRIVAGIEKSLDL